MFLKINVYDESENREKVHIEFEIHLIRVKSTDIIFYY